MERFGIILSLLCHFVSVPILLAISRYPLPQVIYHGLSTALYVHYAILYLMLLSYGSLQKALKTVLIV